MNVRSTCVLRTSYPFHLSNHSCALQGRFGINQKNGQEFSSWHVVPAGRLSRVMSWHKSKATQNAKRHLPKKNIGFSRFTHNIFLGRLRNLMGRLRYFTRYGVLRVYPWYRLHPITFDFPGFPIRLRVDYGLKAVFLFFPCVSLWFGCGYGGYGKLRSKCRNSFFSSMHSQPPPGQTRTASKPSGQNEPENVRDY